MAGPHRSAPGAMIEDGFVVVDLPRAARPLVVPVRGWCDVRYRMSWTADDDWLFTPDPMRPAARPGRGCVPPTTAPLSTDVTSAVRHALNRGMPDTADDWFVHALVGGSGVVPVHDAVPHREGGDFVLVASLNAGRVEVELHSTVLAVDVGQAVVMDDRAVTHRIVSCTSEVLLIGLVSRHVR